MIDPEVARLRRLRSQALLVREIARTFESSQWAANESLLERTACAGWRIARVVSGRLRSHPYSEYQKDAGPVSRLAHRVHAWIIGVTRKSRSSALTTLQTHVQVLGRQLDDAIALAWSSDFSETLARSQFDIKALGAALALETRSGSAPDRPVLGTSGHPVRMSGNLETAIEGDWPYLAL